MAGKLVVKGAPKALKAIGSLMPKEEMSRVWGKGVVTGSKPSLRYAERVRIRALQDPVSHNFPYSFDDIILSTKPHLKNNGYKIFTHPGTINGKEGIFEIGQTIEGIIDHRFFRPF